jgi:hypothetical protein
MPRRKFALRWSQTAIQTGGYVDRWGVLAWVMLCGAERLVLEKVQWYGCRKSLQGSSRSL